MIPRVNVPKSLNNVGRHYFAMEWKNHRQNSAGEPICLCMNKKIKRKKKKIRPDWGSNPGSSVYETDALPLGHRAQHANRRFRMEPICADHRSRLRSLLRSSLYIHRRCWWSILRNFCVDVSKFAVSFLFSSSMNEVWIRCELRL